MYVLVSQDGAEILGSPVIGSSSFYDTAFKRRVDKILQAQECLDDLDNLEIAFQLLRSCIPYYPA